MRLENAVAGSLLGRAAAAGVASWAGMLHAILYFVLGGLAGLVAGHLMSGHAFGWIGDAVVGIVGGLIGGLVFGAVFGTIRFAGVGEALAAIFFACLLTAILHLARPQTVARA
ncbi:MAG: GlsB/YeaQ/YmgE family stress response membrane protein [Candidatus Dormibacteraceae bacterium]